MGREKRMGNIKGDWKEVIRCWKGSDGSRKGSSYSEENER